MANNLSSDRNGPTCAVTYKISIGQVAQFVTLASAAGDRLTIADNGHNGRRSVPRAIASTTEMLASQTGQIVVP